MPKARPLHPLEHHPSFAAVVAAAAPVAAVAAQLPQPALVSAIALACGDVADGLAAPPESRRRQQSLHRAWVAVREIERALAAARRRRLAPADVVSRAQRAIDRADVLIGALLRS